MHTTPKAGALCFRYSLGLGENLYLRISKCDGEPALLKSEKRYIQAKLMNVKKYILVLFGLTILSQGPIFAKSIAFSVDSIFEHITGLSEIKVISYDGDSIMNYIDIESQDTLKLDCKWKKFSEPAIKTPKDNDSNYTYLKGTFPEVGEILFMLTYEYIRNGILFARKENELYRFWDPKSIPFAESVYLMVKTGIYKPTELCKEALQTKTEFYCSDGFIIEEKEFVQIKAGM